jgi:hypothetical protein
LHDLIDEALQDLFEDNPSSPWDRQDGKDAWLAFFKQNAGTQKRAWDTVIQVTKQFIADNT